MVSTALVGLVIDIAILLWVATAPPIEALAVAVTAAFGWCFWLEHHACPTCSSSPSPSPSSSSARPTSPRAVASNELPT